MNCFRVALCAAALAGSYTLAFAQAVPVPSEYVRVCDTYGTGFYYIPGTETCVNSDTQQTRRETEFGTEIGKTSFARSVDERIQRAFEATAIANALQSPDLVAGERFGMRINWGGVEGTNAFGLSGAVVLNDGMFESGKGRLTGSAGIAFSGSTVGGNAGLQLSW